jgi:hypothetical protein
VVAVLDRRAPGRRRRIARGRGEERQREKGCGRRQPRASAHRLLRRAGLRFAILRLAAGLRAALRVPAVRRERLAFAGEGDFGRAWRGWYTPILPPPGRLTCVSRPQLMAWTGEHASPRAATPATNASTSSQMK